MQHRIKHSSRTTPKTRTVEYYRLWAGNNGDSGTWDADFIEIPADTPEDKLDVAIRMAADNLKWRNDEPPVIVGLYCASALDEDLEEENDDPEEDIA